MSSRSSNSSRSSTSSSSQSQSTRHHRRSSHSQRHSHHSRTGSSTTSENSNTASTIVTRIDPSEYNPHMYATHLFIMKLIPSAPFSGPNAHDHSGRITSASIPQWSWDRTQCRSWVEQVLVKREGVARKEARAIAGRLDCEGAGMYKLREADWSEICGVGSDDAEDRRSKRRGDGEGEKRDDDREIARRICGMLKRRRGEDGAVPEAVRALNGW